VQQPKVGNAQRQMQLDFLCFKKVGRKQGRRHPPAEWCHKLAGNGNGRLPVKIIAIGIAHTDVIKIYLMLQRQQSVQEMVIH